MASKLWYPPIVNDSEPAFIEKARIYFSFNKYNIADLSNLSIADNKITNLWTHISVVDKETGKTLVNQTTDNTNIEEPHVRNSGIIVNTVINQVSENQNLFYVEIEDRDIRGGWSQNLKPLKVQIRLSEKKYNLGVDGDGSNIESWLNKTIQNESTLVETPIGDFFSEWSTVCIIKAINKPIVSLSGQGIDSLSAVLTYDGKEELLDRVKFSLYKAAVGSTPEELLEEAVVYANQFIDNGKVRYQFKKQLLPATAYVIKSNYITINGYEDNIQETVNTASQSEATLNYRVQVAEDKSNNYSVAYDEDRGCVSILLDKTSMDAATENKKTYILRRTDMTSDFSIWEDLHTFVGTEVSLANEFNNYVYQDMSIESGVVYKYGLQELLGDIRSKTVVNSNFVVRDFSYGYLFGANEQQLILKYDSLVDSIKTNIKENKVETIGSKYPFIFRNGNIDYKTFSLNGTIAYSIDEEDTFKKDNSLDVFLGISGDLIALYNSFDPIKKQYYYERRFREKVLDFLKDGKVKLFKSATEGNMLVRLTDVQCSFKNELGNLIAEFSCNAIEIDDYTFENCEKYGLKLCTRLKKVTGDYSHSEHNIKPTQSQGGEISGR